MIKDAKQTLGGDLRSRSWRCGLLGLVALASVVLTGCTTIEGEFKDGDTSVYRKITVAPFASIEAEAFKWSYFLDQKGDAAQWQIEMGQSATGLDNSEQATALEIIAGLLARLDAARGGN